MQHLKRPGTWLGLLALVFAMSGSAYAASKITGAQIKDGTITGKDIKNDSISTGKLTSLPVGPSGPAGPAGPAGAAGAPGPNVVAKLAPNSLSFSVPAGTGDSSVQVITANCPVGQRVISGGWITIGSAVAWADKTYDGASWSVGIDNFGNSTAATGSVTALCAPSGVAVASSAGHAKRDADVAHDIARYRSVQR